MPSLEAAEVYLLSESEVLNMKISGRFMISEKASVQLDWFHGSVLLQKVKSAGCS